MADYPRQKRCPICQSDQYFPVRVPPVLKDWPLYQCAGCSTVFLSAELFSKGTRGPQQRASTRAPTTRLAAAPAVRVAHDPSSSR